MRKRERENPCIICGHYHKYEEGEPCGICGHRLIDPAEKGPQQSAFSTEILPGFLYLGSYDNASRSELLKAQGISRILNTVPACQNLYGNSFVYHCLKEDKVLPFDECVDFINKSHNEGARVLVHCMSGQSRSPAVVIAYLMRHKGWRLPESYQWVKERRPVIRLTPGAGQQLQEYEVKVFGDAASRAPFLPSPDGGITFSSSFSKSDPPSISSPFGVLPGAANSVPPAAVPLFSFPPGGLQPETSPGTFVFGSSAVEIPRGGLSHWDTQMDGS